MTGVEPVLPVGETGVLGHCTTRTGHEERSTKTETMRVSRVGIEPT